MREHSGEVGAGCQRQKRNGAGLVSGFGKDIVQEGKTMKLMLLGNGIISFGIFLLLISYVLRINFLALPALVTPVIGLAVLLIGFFRTGRE